MELYHSLFEPFGVSKNQFATLMSHSTSYRAGAGSVIVEGGVPHPKLTLLISGEAVAYKHNPEAEDGRGEAVCRYLGRMVHDSSPDPRHATSEEDVSLPKRGSTIGGVALVDKAVLSKTYPSTVVASTPVEWVEWEVEALQSIIDASQWRSVQASFYRMLYRDLIWTLGREKASREQEEEYEGKDNKVSQIPQTNQLLALTAFVAVPFFGFGFADNFIMILCGDTIDGIFGVRFGLTTMAAAALGNWVSDVVGISLGDAIERWSSKIGLHNGGLSPAQERLKLVQFVSTGAKVLGITLGCFAGMVPLLFISPNKVELSKGEQELFDSVFRGLSTSEFVSLMKIAKRRSGKAGEVMLQGGSQSGKVYLLLRGSVVAKSVDEATKGDQVCMYVGRLEERKPHDESKVPTRGSIIGGSAIGDKSVSEKPYPNDLELKEASEWMEFDLEELSALLEGEKGIQACFFSLLYGEILSTLSKDKVSRKQSEYYTLLSAVVADDVIADEEREFVMNTKQKLKVTDEEHSQVLRELGWTEEEWERGFRDTEHAKRALARAGIIASPETAAEATHQLEQAKALLEGVMLSLQSD